MNIQLFKKKYRKTKEDDGTVLIEPNHLDQDMINEVYTETPHYGEIKDDWGTKRGEVGRTKVLDLTAVKKRFPELVKVKIGDLYIRF